MATFRLRNLGEVGFVGPEVPRFAVPPGGFTKLINARCYGGAVVTIRNSSQFMIGTATASPTWGGNIPYWFMPVVSSSGIDTSYIVYTNSTHLFTATKQGRSFEATRTAGAGTLVAYNAVTNWSGVLISGNPLVTSGSDVPQWLSFPSFSGKFRNLRWDDSAGTTWATRSAGAVYCGVVASLNNHAIALRMTENSTQYYSRVRWSHPYSYGGVYNTEPTTWDDTRLDSQADYVDLHDDGERIVDAVNLGDDLFIYKRTSTWRMSYVGGDSIFAFRKVFNVGAVGLNCTVDIGGRHVVLTYDDIIMHDGVSIQSIATERVRRKILDNYLSGAARAFHHKRNSEVVFTLNGMVMVYNYVTQKWYELSQGSIYHAASHIYLDEITGETKGSKFLVSNLNDSMIYDFDPLSSTAATCTASLEMPLLLGKTPEIALTELDSLKKIRRLTPYFECSASAFLGFRLIGYHTPAVTDGRTASGAVTLSTTMHWNCDVTGYQFQLEVYAWSMAPIRWYGLDVEYDVIGKR